MNEAVTILQADACDRNLVLVTLLDGRVLVVNLEQILSVNPQELPAIEEDEDSTEY